VFISVHVHIDMMDKDLIPFNGWSKERILAERKCSTSRHKRYAKDPLVVTILDRLPWGTIKEKYYLHEGADSPEELQKVIEEIYQRKVPDDETFYLHFFDGPRMKERLTK
jgi:hypothetical protein